MGLSSEGVKNVMIDCHVSNGANQAQKGRIIVDKRKLIALEVVFVFRRETKVDIKE